MMSLPILRFSRIGYASEILNRLKIVSIVSDDVAKMFAFVEIGRYQ